MKALTLVIALLVLCVGCKKESDLTKYISSQIPVQVFELLPGQDTILVTKSGIRLKIKPCSFIGTKTKFTLRVQEIIGAAQLGLSNLNTIDAASNPLISTGMLGLSATQGVQVNPDCPIVVEMPVEAYAQGMKVYRGIEQNDELRWEAVDTLKNNKVLDHLAKGEVLFKEKCVSCHAEDLCTKQTGPALGCIEEGLFARRRDWLIAFTEDSQKLIEEGDPIALELWNQYKPTVMSSFDRSSINPPKDPKAEIKLIYDFIKEKSLELKLCDCKPFLNRLDITPKKEKRKKKKLNVEKPSAWTIPMAIDPVSRMVSFEISEMGLYNIDRILEPIDKLENFEVTVSDPNVYINLILPEYSMQLPLDPNGSNVFSFKSTGANGLINLPADAEGYLVATGLKNSEPRPFGIVGLVTGKDKHKFHLNLESHTDAEIKRSFKLIEDPAAERPEEDWSNCSECHHAYQKR